MIGFRKRASIRQKIIAISHAIARNKIANKILSGLFSIFVSNTATVQQNVRKIKCPPPDRKMGVQIKSPGSPAALSAANGFRPVALHPCLSEGMPFSKVLSLYLRSAISAFIK